MFSKFLVIFRKFHGFAADLAIFLLIFYEIVSEFHENVQKMTNFVDIPSPGTHNARARALIRCSSSTFCFFYFFSSDFRFSFFTPISFHKGSLRVDILARTTIFLEKIVENSGIVDIFHSVRMNISITSLARPVGRGRRR